MTGRLTPRAPARSRSGSSRSPVFRRPDISSSRRNDRTRSYPSSLASARWVILIGLLIAGAGSPLSASLGQGPGGFPFQVAELLDAPAEVLLRAEFGGEECFDDVTGHLRPDDPCADAHHVHVVVFDGLACHERVMADRRADARDLVGCDAGPCTGAAEQDDPLDLSVADQRDRVAGDVREVDGRIRVRPDV